MRWLKQDAQKFKLPRAYKRCQSCRHFRKSMTDGQDFVNGNFCCHLPDMCPFYKRAKVYREFKIKDCNLYGKRDPKVVCYIGEVSPFIGKI
jgi:hypothetical protein